MPELPPAMHIPDGFLSPGVAAALFVVAVAVVGRGLRDAEARMDESRVPMLGVLAAFIFAAQMLNFPVAGGTSGHVLGAALAAVLLGPSTACVVMAVVVLVQALAFADGGLTALGANVVNMGVVGALLAGFCLSAGVRLLDPGRTLYLGIVAVVAWLTVVAARRRRAPSWRFRERCRWTPCCRPCSPCTPSSASARPWSPSRRSAPCSRPGRT